MSKKVIYVAGPYRAKHEYQVWGHIMTARSNAAYIWNNGHIAICPHLNTMFMGGMQPDEVWLEGNLEILRRCDVLFVDRSGWNKSEGVEKEIVFAKENNIPVIIGRKELTLALMNWALDK